MLHVQQHTHYDHMSINIDMAAVTTQCTEISYIFNIIYIDILSEMLKQTARCLPVMIANSLMILCLLRLITI